MSSFDIIVVGAGHAGCEAAAAAARLGRRVAMVTFHLEHIARLSCNPAIGGLAKGTLVRELDALGGLMARVADATTIQFRRLNTRKGLAVRSSRAQVDTHAYPRRMRALLDAIPSLTLVEGEAAGLLFEGDVLRGVQLADGVELLAPVVILTTGTFLSGKMHKGEEQSAGGRIGDGAAYALSHDLRARGLRLGRLKTGTPPRLAADSIDWDRLEVQEDHSGQFSFATVQRELEPVVCHIAYTSAASHDVIRDNLHRSAMYSGRIDGIGPRYCPSVEDKIARFPERERHQLYLEPEGHETPRVYVNGLSTSLPESVQDAVLRTIVGLESARVLQYGYAVEYDYADPLDLGHDLQHTQIRGLYLAGQVNGTSGYEEAACQGFIAGVNAAGRTLRLTRDEAYIGVLIDDLVTRGIGGEPYRMFSSRAEHRLLLREDNADRRLCGVGRELGLVDDAQWARFQAKLAEIERGRSALQASVRPDLDTLAAMAQHGVGTLRQPASAEELLRRPGVSYDQLSRVIDLPALSHVAALQVETDVKYAGYIQRERGRAARARKLARMSLVDVDFAAVPSLSSEVRERLSAARPIDLRSASRLPGVTPAAITALTLWLSRKSA